VQLCNAQQYYIPYKGGHVEEDVLMKCNANYIINIESIGTPKFETIWRAPEYHQYAQDFKVKIIGDTADHTQCTRHRASRDRILHCPITEVQYFAAWIVFHYHLHHHHHNDDTMTTTTTTTDDDGRRATTTTDDGQRRRTTTATTDDHRHTQRTLDGQLSISCVL